MDRADFLQVVTSSASILINDTPVSSLSEAVLAVGHLSDATTPEGTSVSVPWACVQAWDALESETRRGLWDDACAGRLDAEPPKGANTEAHIDDDQLWTAVLGLDTPEQMIATAEDQRLTPQDYIGDAVRIAREQGLTVDADEAFRRLCKMAEVFPG